MNSYTISELEEVLNKCSYEDYNKIKLLLMDDGRKNVQKLIKKAEKRFLLEEKLIREYYARKKYELALTKENYRYIAGVDEVGRGPLAGPVYAAAVILDINNDIYGIRDSKKLSEKQRIKLSEEIKKKCISYSIAYATIEEIDSYNILNATKLAMKRAVEGLDIRPDYVLVDAIRIDDILIPQKSIIKGDDLSVSIGAASIIAKVERDNFMEEISVQYPEYLFSKNKGYGTKEHIEAIKKHGICQLHRKTFVRNFI